MMHFLSDGRYSNELQYFSFSHSSAQPYLDIDSYVFKSPPLISLLKYVAYLDPFVDVKQELASDGQLVSTSSDILSF